MNSYIGPCALKLINQHFHPDAPRHHGHGVGRVSLCVNIIFIGGTSTPTPRDGPGEYQAKPVGIVEGGWGGRGAYGC